MVLYVNQCTKPSKINNHCKESADEGEEKELQREKNSSTSLLHAKAPLWINTITVVLR